MAAFFEHAIIFEFVFECTVWELGDLSERFVILPVFLANSSAFQSRRIGVPLAILSYCC
jgi:hypothetical protein